MNTIISTIVEETEAQSRQHSEERERKWNELLELAKEELHKVFEQVNGLYQAIEPYIVSSHDFIFRNHQESVTLEWIIQSDELELAPIKARITVPNSAYYGKYFNVDGHQIEVVNVRQAIALAHSSFLEWRQKEDESFVSARSGKFYYWSQRSKEAMQKAYDELMERFPARKDEWDKVRDIWLAERDSQVREAEEEKKRKQAHAILKEALKAEWIKYFQEADSILEANAYKANLIQEELNQPFTVWKLVYGFTSEYEGETITETTSMYVRHATPDENRMWTRLDGTKVGLFHLVSIEPVTTTPVDAPYGLYLQRSWEQYGISLFCSLADEARLNDLVSAAGFEMLPNKPARPDEISWDEEEHIINEVRCQANPANITDDIAF